MNCKNCDTSFDTNFCPQCGQSADVKRITMAGFVSEFSEGVFQVNHGLFYTLSELFVRPGYTLREYLRGKRKDHFKPLPYLITFSTLYFIASRLFGGNTWMNDFIFGFENFDDNSQQTVAPIFFAWLSQNFAYASLLLLPIFAFASYLAFRNRGFNYAEHAVINAFITGQQALIYTILIILSAPFDHVFLELLPTLISLLYFFWVYNQFFQPKATWSNLLRSALTYLIYFLVNIVLLLVAGKLFSTLT